METENQDLEFGKHRFRGIDITPPENVGLSLKGILKTRLETTLSDYLDFKNDYRITSDIETSSPKIKFGLEPHSAQRMEGDDERTFAEERLNSQNKDEDSYFIASSSYPTKTSKWPRRERESSSIFSTTMKDYYPKEAVNSRGKCQNNYGGRPESFSLERRLIFRLFQVSSILLIIIGIVTLVIPSISTPNFEQLFQNSSSLEITGVKEPKINIREALQKWLIENPESRTFGQNFSTNSSLLDISHFHFTLNNFQLCEPSSTNSSNGIYFVILVHSAPNHFIERQAIRTTWGSVKSFRNWSFRLIFLMGEAHNPHEMSNSDVREEILNESDLYGDIVTGNFEDTYRNLTYKHLMGYKWVLSHCPLAKFVIKTDDDVFIDIFQVFDFAQRNYGLNPVDILLCNIYPEGTKPVRNSSLENPGGYKWIVTKSEYPFDIYPKYCGGLGYLVTVDVIERLNRISHSLKRFLWIDDVFVTGVIRELARKEPFYLNLRYSYDEVEYRIWLNDRSSRHRLRKIPYMFVHVTRGSRYDEDMARLWRRTVRAWS